MPKKGEKSTGKSAEAGQKNLAKYREINPRPALKHGVYSAHFAARYSDARTSEGRQLKAVIANIAKDLGPDLNAMQCMLIDRIKEKLIVLWQIGKYVDTQSSIINEKGEVLACLTQTYTRFSDALRRDITTLYGVIPKKQKAQNLNEYLETNYGKKWILSKL